MKLARLIAFLLILLSSGSAMWAEDQAVGPGRFTKSIDIQLEPGQPFYKLQLGESVYRNLTTQNIRDIQIYDALNQSLPVAILPTQRREIVNTIVKSSNLPYFPLYASPASQLDNLSIHVQRDQRGSIVNVNLKNGKTGDERKNLVAYLIDATKFDRPVTNFNLFWDVESRDTPIVRLKVEYSDDLATWKTVDIDNVMALLKHQGKVLTKSGIQAGDKQSKYFRISWPDSPGGIVITRLAAVSIRSEGRDPELKWTKITGIPDPEGRNAYLYDTGGYFPVQRARIKLPSGVISASISLESTARLVVTPDRHRRIHRMSDLLDPRKSGRSNYERSKKPYWINRSFNTPVYDIDINGIKFRTDDIKVHTTFDRYWRMKLDPEAGQSAEVPVLEIGWVPDTAVFPGIGKPPYRLMVGSERSIIRNSNGDHLIYQMKSKELQPASATLIEKGESKRLIADTGGKFSAHSTLNLLLWAVMVAGVLTLAWMAYRLVKQLNDPDTNS